MIDNLLQLEKHITHTGHNRQDIMDDIIQPMMSYYDSIIGCMPGNVYWMNQHCRTMGCNKNVLNMLGLASQEDFKDLGFEDLARIGKWSSDAALAFRRDTLEVIRTGRPKLNLEELPIPHHDGRVIYFLTNRVPLLDATGQIIGMVGISFDITDRKLAEEQLREALTKVETLSKAKTEFITNMSHDVKKIRLLAKEKGDFNSHVQRVYAKIPANMIPAWREPMDRLWDYPTQISSSQGRVGAVKAG